MVAGSLKRFGSYGLFEPRDNRLPDDFYLKVKDMAGAIDGQLVMAQVWVENDGRLRRAKVKQVLGKAGEAEVEWRAIITDHDLREKYPEPAIVAARSLSEPSKDDLAGREDFSRVTTVTIDGADARDFDDAISIKRTPQGYQLGVHIADVSHYVRPEGAIDKEAYTRATSVYFPNQVLHMLPRELSENLCSLRPDVRRLTLSVVIDFDEHGARQDYRVCKSYIHSRKRCTYAEVQEVLDGSRRKDYASLTGELKLMNELEAEVSGEVVEILVENAEPVEFGQTLMLVRPS